MQGDASWQRLAAATVYPKPYVVPGPGPVEVRDDFEKGEVTPLLGIAALSNEGRAELIALTDSVAASGKRSLRIQGRPDLKAAYNPHFYYTPNHADGVSTCSFDMRVEAGVVMYHEWRDSSTPYKVGPSFWVKEGQLTVSKLIGG